jgi:DNA-binding NtrC family response regulator
MDTILVVDDQLKPRRLLIDELEDAGFDVSEASDGEEAWERFRSAPPDLVITDMMMPRCDGLELLRRIRIHSEVPVIVFSGYGSVQTAADAIKAGAQEFISSLDVEVDELVDLVRKAIRKQGSEPSLPDLESRIVGTSAAAQRLRWQITGLAPLGAPALVTGEPGSGRSTAVRALHDLGSSAAGKLTRIEARTFTPPCTLDAPGAVHIANVDELSPEGQSYWANRLARSEVHSFNGRLRVLATSDKPAALMGSQGASPDLFRMLLRFHIEVPALRDREGDIPLVAHALVERVGKTLGRHQIHLSPASIRFLETCHFPGNAKQLQQVLERAIAFTRGRVIQRDPLKRIVAELDHSVANIRDQRRELERHQLIQTIRETGGNITHTAEALGKSRAAIYRLMQKNGIALNRPD